MRKMPYLCIFVYKQQHVSERSHLPVTQIILFSLRDLKWQYKSDRKNSLQGGISALEEALR